MARELSLQPNIQRQIIVKFMKIRQKFKESNPTEPENYK